MELKRFAEVSWNVEDLRAKIPDASDDELEEILDDNENIIQTAMIEAGWNAIHTIISVREMDKDLH